tara:strand:+ start:59 stop:340 length:282 start_codon:yes stop_codon:yes gene_type:complete
MTRQPISAGALQIQRTIRKDERVLSMNVSEKWVSIQLTWEAMALMAKDAGVDLDIRFADGALYARMKNGRLDFWAVFVAVEKTRAELMTEAGL